MRAIALPIAVACVLTLAPPVWSQEGKSDKQRIAALEKEVAALKLELVDLRSALELLAYQRRPDPNAVPQLEYKQAEETEAITRHYLTITNSNAFSDDLFRSSPDLPPIGRNKSASRTSVRIHDYTGRRLYGFVAFDSAADLDSIWFAVRKGTPPPMKVYVVLYDRKLKRSYKSNPVSIPSP